MRWMCHYFISLKQKLELLLSGHDIITSKNDVMEVIMYGYLRISHFKKWYGVSQAAHVIR